MVGHGASVPVAAAANVAIVGSVLQYFTRWIVWQWPVPKLKKASYKYFMTI